MGCGTGILLAQEDFRIRLQFSPKIAKTSPIYTNFESAVRGFLRDRLDSWTPNISGGKVNTIDVSMHGPIQTVEEQAQFNRGINRLLWGVRMICSDAAGGGAPAPSNFEVNVLELQKGTQQPTGPDWTFEDTCNARLKTTYKRPRKAPAKRKAAAKAKAAAKQKARAKR